MIIAYLDLPHGAYLAIFSNGDIVLSPSVTQSKPSVRSRFTASPEARAAAANDRGCHLASKGRGRE